MAKTVQTLPGAPGPADAPFHRWQDVPWEAAESAAGVGFSDAEKAEIYTCAWIAYQERHHLENGTRLDTVQRLRDDIFNAAKAFAEIGDEYLPSGSFRQHGKGWQQRLGVVGNLLTQYFTHPTGASTKDASDALLEAIRASRVLVQTLESEPAHRVSATRQDADALALCWFVSMVLNGVSERTARSKQRGAVERFRWGMQVGPKVGAFRRLTEIMLDRPITPHQMDAAFRRVLG